MWGKKDERPAIVDVYRESGFPFKCQLTGIDEKDYQNIILNLNHSFSASNLK